MLISSFILNNSQYFVLSQDVKNLIIPEPTAIHQFLGKYRFFWALKDQAPGSTAKSR